MLEVVDIPIDDIYETNVNVALICNCGYGSGYSKYMQKPSSEFLLESNIEPIRDTNLFLFTFVPLPIFRTSDNNVKEIWWENATPSSTLLCCPSKIVFKKEFKQLINEKFKQFKIEISKLNSTMVVKTIL